MLELVLALVVFGSASGDTFWLRRYAGVTGQDEKPSCVLCDSKGNAIVGGYTSTQVTDFNFLLVKYDTLGRLLWTRTYGSPLNSEDRIWAMGRDDSDNIYVAGGSIADPVHGWDYVTAKYRPNGDTAWLRRYDSPFHQDDKPAAIAIDKAGRVYVTGASVGGASGWDYLTVKYDNNGDTVWTRRLDGAGHAEDAASTIALASGRVVISGKSFNDAGIPEIFTVTYDSTGKLLWNRTFRGTWPGYNFANSVAASPDSCIYVAGTVTDQGVSYDLALLKYSLSGDLLWSRIYDGPAHRVDVASGMRLMPGGGAVITGQSLGSGTGQDFVTISYGARGETLWIRRYNDTLNRADKAWALAVDHDGKVYVAGSGVTGGSFESYEIVAYDPTGELLWARNYRDIGPGDSRPVAVALNRQSVIVTGFVTNQAGDLDIVTIAYRK